MSLVTLILSKGAKVRGQPPNYRHRNNPSLCRRGPALTEKLKNDCVLALVVRRNLLEHHSPNKAAPHTSTALPLYAESWLSGPNEKLVARVELRMGAVTWAIRPRPVSYPRSSNRTCRSPASGSPTGFTVGHTASKPTARGFDTVIHSPSPRDTAVSDGACL